VYPRIQSLKGDNMVNREMIKGQGLAEQVGHLMAITIGGVHDSEMIGFLNQLSIIRNESSDETEMVEALQGVIDAMETYWQITSN